MEFQEVVRRRRMVRTFTGEPVPQESLDRILGNAVRGPSAGFSQGQSFLVLTERTTCEKFWAVAGEAIADSAQTAPLVIVPMSCKRVYLERYAQPDKGWTDRDEARWPVPFWHIDTGMAALLILQTVVDEGLGAVYFGIVPEAVAPFRAAFGVPDDQEPIGAIAIGYDAEPAKRDLRSRRRYPADDDPLRPLVRPTAAPSGRRLASLDAGWPEMASSAVALRRGRGCLVRRLVRVSASSAALPGDRAPPGSLSAATMIASASADLAERRGGQPPRLADDDLERARRPGWRAAPRRSRRTARRPTSPIDAPTSTETSTSSGEMRTVLDMMTGLSTWFSNCV